MTGAFAGAFATGHLISLADEWSSVNARLKQASQSSDEFSSSQKADGYQWTGTAFSDNAALFARSAASMREYGYSADDVLKVTEAISTGLKIRCQYGRGGLGDHPVQSGAGAGRNAW
nr:tape measure protein [Escherichia coli]